MYVSIRYIDAIVKPIFRLSATQTRLILGFRDICELALWVTATLVQHLPSWDRLRPLRKQLVERSNWLAP